MTNETNAAHARTRRPGATKGRDFIQGLGLCKPFDPTAVVALSEVVPASTAKATGPRNVARKQYKADASKAQQSDAWHMWAAIVGYLNRQPYRAATVGELGDALANHFKRAKGADGKARTVPKGYSIGGELTVLMQRGVVIGLDTDPRDPAQI